MNDRQLMAQEVSGQGEQGPLFVMFTTVQDTLFCLRSVNQLGRNLSLRIYLLASDQAPSSPVLLSARMLADFTARYFFTMLPHQSHCVTKIVCYPDSSEDLWEIIPPQSFIALAGPSHRLWPSAAQRLARKLRQAGHEVLFFPTQSLGSDFFSHKQ